MPQSVERHRLAAATPLLYCSILPVAQIAIVLSVSTGYRAPLAAAAATAVYLPLHLRHVSYAVRGEQAPASVVALLVMTAVIAAALPFAGQLWLPSFHAVAVSALLLLRPRWSVPIFAGLTVAMIPLARTVPDLTVDAWDYYALTLVWRTASVYIPIRLARAVNEVRSAQRALAESAVLGERIRVDTELRRTVGEALADIAVDGHRAADLALTRPEDAVAVVGALVRRSRNTYTDARRIVKGFQTPSARTELDTAVRLLSAAGITVDVRLPSDPGLDHADATFRAELHVATARLLRDDDVRACTITVTSSDRALHVDLAATSAARSA